MDTIKKFTIALVGGLKVLACAIFVGILCYATVSIMEYMIHSYGLLFNDVMIGLVILAFGIFMHWPKDK